MIEFFTTQGINYHLEEIFKNANSKLILISPYIQLQRRLKELLLTKKQQDVEINIVCRKDSLKEPITDYSTQIFDVPTLHAKCYLNENEAILTSLNLYEFSQQNNDEMGIYVKNEGAGSTIFQEMLSEAERLCKTSHMPPPPPSSELTVGEQYSADKLQTIFRFDYQGRAGIKESAKGNIVLFSNSNSPYPLIERDNIIYYQGQNTGGLPQQLIYGNKMLFDSYQNSHIKIFLFKDSIFSGEYHIAKQPYLDNGIWIFPLSVK